MSLKTGAYQHYKGQYYEELGTAMHTATQEDVVVYRSLYGAFELWVRPLTMFTEMIVYEGKEMPRFAFVSRDAAGV